VGEVALLAMAAHMEMILTFAWASRLAKRQWARWVLLLLRGAEWGPEHAELYQNIVVRSSVRCHV